jgi:hypothetical protein
MIASGGLSGGLSSSIAGGSFADGFRQGIITSGLNHAMHFLVIKIQDPNLIRAKEIQRRYGGDVFEIKKFLDKHPFEYMEGGGVKLKGFNLEVKFTNPPNTNGKEEIIKFVVDEVIEHYATKGLELVFGKGAGFLLSDGGLANNPNNSQNDIIQRQIRINTLENILIEFIFSPMGTQTPTMHNGFKSKFGPSRFDMYYKYK